MPVDSNVTNFIDKAINDPDFRHTLDSGDRRAIIDALSAANGFNLTDQEREIAANAWLALEPEQRHSLGSLEHALGHFNPHHLGN